MSELNTKAQAVQAAQESTIRYINSYQDTLVQWIDEEGRIQIDTFLNYQNWLASVR